MVVTGTACGSSAHQLRTERTGAILWTPCGNVQCGSLSVPLDRVHPTGPQITLALARLPATGKRVGVLFTNPGGPGASGVDFLRSAGSVFRREILQRFDIVSWDPRGVGRSSPVNCADDLDPFYAVDRSPTDAAGVQRNVDAAKQFVAGCVQRSARLLPFVSSTDTARDMDAIRDAMGEQQISYLGFSYGTFLGALYAHEFPQRVRALVLDGAIDPALSYADSTVAQGDAFDRELDAFFDWCKHDTKCGFAQGGDPRTAYESLARAIRDEPEPATVRNEHRTLGPGEFDIGVASALYSGEDGFPTLAAALVETAQGLGDQLLALADRYTGRSLHGQYSNETAALYAISCLDGPSPASVDDVARVAEAATSTAPDFGPSTTWLGLPCAYWPARPRRGAPSVDASRAPPLLVVGSTLDPATPYAWAQALTRQLHSARLLTRDGDGHTSYGRGSDCLDGAVDRYLLTMQLPPPNTHCPA